MAERKYFNENNTEDFSEETLDAMNERMVELGADDYDECYEASELKALTEKVFNEFC